MIDIKKFKTRTEFHNKRFPFTGDVWPVGLDIGYSGVKAVCPAGAFCFPAYARKIVDEQAILKSDDDNDLYYRDETGLWCVGETAYAQLVPGEAIESDSELFGRNRYYTEIFKVVSNVGIALSFKGNSEVSPSGKKITIQTGLPPKYKNADTGDLINALSGDREFSLKVGKSGWEQYKVTINKEDIYVMPQPKGALISASISKEGKLTPEAKNFFSTNVIIPDTGFGTFDIFTITHGVVAKQDTFPELGMREVFARCCNDISKQYDTEVTVSQMQNYLTKGTVPIFSRENLTRINLDFSEILEKECKNVCNESINKILDINYNCRDTDYIIPTGGVYDLWKNTFNNAFAGMESLHIVPANINDTELGNVFSNARGYYFNVAMR